MAISNLGPIDLSAFSFPGTPLPTLTPSVSDGALARLLPSSTLSTLAPTQLEALQNPLGQSQQVTTALLVLLTGLLTNLLQGACPGCGATGGCNCNGSGNGGESSGLSQISGPSGAGGAGSTGSTGSAAGASGVGATGQGTVVNGKAFPVLGNARFSNDFHAPRSGGRQHQGTDIFAPVGTPVVAFAPGTVRRLRNETEGGLGGNTVTIQGDDGNSYYYAHLDQRVNGLQEGQRIEAGQQIGTVGMTGNARGTEPHLHFSINEGTSNNVNPFPLLQQLQNG